MLATFALGTATGDMTAKTLNLGYLASGIWFSVAFAAVAVAHWKFGLNPILAFWIAYVLTRPVGASFADYVAFPRSVGGLGVGHGPVALVLTVVIAILVGYLAVTRKDVEVPPAAVPPGAARHRRAMPPQPGSRPAPAAHRAAVPRPAVPAGAAPGGGISGQRQYPDERYPGQPRPGAPRPPVPPRPVPPPPGPPPRSASPPPPGDQWPSRGQRPRQDPPPRQDQPPSRRSWDDEDEAERTAEGFFAWDE